MQIKSLLLNLLAVGMVSICAVPKHAHALMLGDVKLHSWLGEPLHVSIPIRAGTEEQLDGSCFHLGRPSPSDEYDSYLTQGKLTLEESATGLKLRLTTSKPVNSPFLNIIVEARCGQGLQRREFVLLLDPPDHSASVVKPKPSELHSINSTPAPASSYVRQGEIYTLLAGESINDIVERLYPGDAQMQRRMAKEIKRANPEISQYSRKRPFPENRSIHIPDMNALPPVSEKLVPVVQSVLSAGEPERPVKLIVKSESLALKSKPAVFQLRLSGDILDMSVVGSMSEEQRQFLREKQLLLEADDQVAAMMSIKNRISQLESTIEEMKLALDQASRASAEGSPEHVAVNDVVMTETPDRQPDQAFQINIRDMDWRQLVGNDSVRSMAGALLILLLLLSSWWRWRQSRAEAKLNTLFGHQFEAEPEQTMQFEPPVRSDPLPAETGIPAASHRTAREKNEMAQQGEDIHYPTTIFGATDDIVTVTETESVLDEADLYLAYGWGKRAIDLLLSHLDRYPNDVPLLKKMFEAYHALGMKNEFEQLAVQSQSIDDSGLRILVQKLGRALDEESPLYQNSLDAEDAFAEDMNPMTIPMVEESETGDDSAQEVSETLEFEFVQESAKQPEPDSRAESDSQIKPDARLSEQSMEWPEIQQKTIEGRKI